MDEEDRKRVAAAAKAKAQAALDNAVVASPNGTVVKPSVSTAAKNRAKAVLAGKTGGTAFEEEPGFWNQLGHSIKRGVKSVVGEELPSEGDYDPKMLDPTHDALGPLGYPTAPATFAVGLLDTLKNRDARLGKITPLTTALNSILDIASIGKLNEAEAAMDQLYDEIPQNVDDDAAAKALSDRWQAETGQPSFPEFAKRLDDVALEQQAVRDANPGTALGFDVGTMAITGATFGKLAFSAANKIPGIVGRIMVGTTPGRVVLGSGVGAGETFAYSYNKNGDLEKAAADAALSMLGGLTLGGIVAVGGNKLYNHLTGKMAPDAIQASTGAILLDAMNNDLAKKGLPPLTASSFAEQIAAAGPGATALDVFPGLQKYANRIISEGEDAASALHSLVATRASFFKDLVDPQNGVLRTAFQSPAILSEQTLLRNAKAHKQAMGPAFDKAYADYAGKRVSAKQILANIKTTFGDPRGWADDFIDAFDLVKGQVAAYTKQAKGDLLTVRQANGLHEFASNAINKQSVKVAGKDAAVASTNRSGRAMTKVKAVLTGMIDAVAPEITKLNARYGDLASMKTAYKAGKKAFASKDIDSADIMAFMSDPDKSLLAKRAFVEGAKFHLFKRFNDAKSAASIEKLLVEERPLIENMEALFGKEQTDEMIAAVLPHIRKTRVAEQLDAASLMGRGRDFIENTGPALKEATDLGIAIAGPFGITSKAGAFGALGRLLGKAPRETIEGQADTYAADILTQMGDGASSSFSELQKMLQRAALASSQGDVSAPAAAAAATGGGQAIME